MNKRRTVAAKGLTRRQIQERLLEKWRLEVWEANRELIKLLARRDRLVRNIGDKKSSLGQPIYCPDVEKDSDLRVAREARARGVSPRFARHLFRDIRHHSRLVQNVRRNARGRAKRRAMRK